MKTPGKWQFFLLNTRPEEGFTRDIASKIVRTLELSVPFVLAYVVYSITRLVSLRVFEQAEKQLVLVHWWYAILSATVLVVALILGRNVRRHATKLLTISITYSILSCLWAVLCVYLSFHRLDNTTVYYVAILTTASLSFLRPFLSLVLYLGSEALLLTLAVWAKVPPDSLTEYAIVSTIITALSLIISYARYASARTVYSTHRAAVAKQKEIEEINRKLRVLVHTDDLTGLYNRRFLDDFLPGIWNGAIDSRTPLAFLMLDIDDFKKLNDSDGHQAGDRCIVRIAQVLAQQTDRGRDYVLRYGGEEFVVIMVGVTLEQAIETAERLRAEVEAQKIPNRASSLSASITISIGVYHAVPSTDCSSRRFFSRADEAMYEAKRAGKNRVVAFCQSPEHPPGQYERVQV